VADRRFWQKVPILRDWRLAGCPDREEKQNFKAKDLCHGGCGHQNKGRHFVAENPMGARGLTWKGGTGICIAVHRITGGVFQQWGRTPGGDSERFEVGHDASEDDLNVKSSAAIFRCSRGSRVGRRRRKYPKAIKIDSNSLGPDIQSQRADGFKRGRIVYY